MSRWNAQLIRRRFMTEASLALSLNVGRGGGEGHDQQNCANNEELIARFKSGTVAN